jgi:hypothetical protein
MEQTPDFCCIATACEQQWLQIGERGIVYSQKQNRIAGLDAVARQNSDLLSNQAEEVAFDVA